MRTAVPTAVMTTRWQSLNRWWFRLPFRGGFFPFEWEPDLAFPEEEEEEETAVGVLVDSNATSRASANAVTWVACFLPSCWCFLRAKGAGEAVGVLSTEEAGGEVVTAAQDPFHLLLEFLLL